MRPRLTHLLEYLTTEQVAAIHQAVLQVLWEVGVRVEWRPALEVYAANGCKVDFERRIVHIPEDVLMKALRSAPAEFKLHGLRSEHDVKVTLEDVYTVAGSSAINVLDLDGRHRPAALQDLVDFTRLIDSLEMADIMHAMVVPQEIPQVGFDRILFATIFQNSAKHYYSQGQGGQSVSDQVELASLIQGGRQAVARTPVLQLCSLPDIAAGAHLRAGSRDDRLRRKRDPAVAGSDEYDGGYRTDHDRGSAGGAHCEHSGECGDSAAGEPGERLHLRSRLGRVQHALGDLCGSFARSSDAALCYCADGAFLPAAF